MRLTSFNDSRRATTARRCRAIRAVRFELGLPKGDADRCGGGSSASPTCRTTPRVRDERCFEAYNIQVAGLERACARPASRRS